MREEIPKTDYGYHKYHRNRFVFAWEIIKKLNPKSTLEIGAWTLTYWLRYNKYRVDTLGFVIPQLRQMRGMNDYDYEYHLKNIPNKETWLKKKYDLIIIAEVIEHLPFSLDRIFDFLVSMVNENGRILLQTPNGVSLKRRMAMVAGRNPFDLICDFPDGTYKHLREPTIQELVLAGHKNGLVAEKIYCKNYFDYTHSAKASVYKFVCDLLPKSFHDGITVVFKKV